MGSKINNVKQKRKGESHSPSSAKRGEEMENVRPIKLHDEETNETYTLEFTRESVKFAEQRGFDVTSFKPMTDTYNLFFYAFRANHRNVPRSKTDKIIDDWGGVGNLPEGLIERLVELYTVPFENTPSEAKNSHVTVEF